MPRLKLTISSLLGLVFLSVGGSVAQTKFFTLNDYLKVALKLNALITSSKLEVDAASYRSEAISEGYLPQIGINSQLYVAPSRGYDPTVTNGGQFGAQLGASYILYNGGLKSLQIGKGNLGILQGNINVKKLEADVLYNTSVAYVFAVKEKRELAVLEESVELLKNYLTLVTELHVGGQASQSDVLKTSVRLNNALIEEDAKKSSRQNALLVLSRESGVPASEVTDVDTSVAVVKADSSFGAASNLDLAAAQLEKQNADLDAEIVRTQSKPSVSLAADAGALTSLPNLQQGLSNVFGASIGISFTMPVIDYGYYGNQFKAAQLKAQGISEQNDFLKKSLEAEFALSRNNYVQANKELKALTINLSTAQQDLVLSKAKYAGGGSSSIEVLDAIQSINDIEVSMEETKYTILVSAFKMRRLNYSGADLNEW